MVVKAYILFKVNSGTERKTCEQMANFKEVSVANIIFGEYDIIAKVSLEDLEALETFITERVRKVPSIILTSTMIIAREYKGITQRNKN